MNELETVKVRPVIVRLMGALVDCEGVSAAVRQHFDTMLTDSYPTGEHYGLYATVICPAPHCGCNSAASSW